MRRQLLGLGFAAASSLLALHAAQAMTGPQPITIDGGPLGSLSLSGGVDGYGYVVTPQPDNLQTTGMNVTNSIIELQKTTGELQFTIEVGSSSTQSLGALSYDSSGHIANTTTNFFSTGPLYAGYITVAPPNSPVTVSAGMLNSLEGYESGFDWNNPSQFSTLMYYVENSQARGVQMNLTEGPLTAEVQFGDGYDTGVFNFLQALVSYSFNSSNVLSVFYGGNLGTTGLNTFGYGNITTGEYGAQFVNSQMVGAYYNYTNGNLNLVPEVQYQYAKENAKVGLFKSSSNIGAAVIGNYSFANTPYSLGGFVEYFGSHSSAENNSQTWAIGPNAQAVGFALSPTWQYKYLFARANAGYVYLLHNEDTAGNKYGYGGSGTGRNQFTGTLEAGLLF